MERLEIIETLKHFPDRLEAEIAGMPDDVLRRRPAEDDWSIKEIMGHLSYAEEIWYRRLYIVWSMHDPVLVTFNPEAERTAIERAYEASNLGSYIADLKGKRPRIVELLNHAVDWTRTGQWLGVGRRSLKQLAEALLQHDQEHIAEIEALKAPSGTGAARQV